MWQYPQEVFGISSILTSDPEDAPTTNGVPS
jgi:hypothetical protein